MGVYKLAMKVFICLTWLFGMLYFFASTLRSDSDTFYEKSKSFSYFNSDGLKEFSYERESNNALNPNSPEYIEQLKQNITNLENQLKWVSIVSDEKETKLTKARNLLGEVWSQETVKDKKITTLTENNSKIAENIRSLHGRVETMEASLREKDRLLEKSDWMYQLKDKNRTYPFNVVNRTKTEGVFNGPHNENFPCLPVTRFAVPAIWVLVTSQNDADLISTAIETLHRQIYPVKALYVDDHSTDGTQAIIAHHLRNCDITINTRENNCGRSCALYTGLEYLKEMLDANDVVMLIDARDYLSSEEASRVLADAYHTASTWVTYGTEERFSTPPAPLSRSDFMNLRKNNKQVILPLSFRLGIYGQIQESDFKNENNEFLTHYYVNSLFYRLVEVSGYSRVAHIPKKLYHHRVSGIEIEKSETTGIQKHISSMAPSQSLQDIHIIMCVFAREEYLQNTFDDLANSTVVGRIFLHICVNAIDMEGPVQKQIKSHPQMRVEYQYFSGNHYGFARFEYAKQLMSQIPIDYAIFVDDDERFPKDYVERLWKIRQPKFYIGWYGYQLFADGDYWKPRDPNFKQLINAERLNVTKFDYVGTGGSIIDAGVFQLEELFQCPDEFRSVEDLWLSYIVQALGWGRRRTTVRPILLAHGKAPASLWSVSGMHVRKNNLLEYIKQRGFSCGWNDDSPLHKSDKTKLIEKL